MNDPKSTDEFHETTLSELVCRLGPPPADVVEAWRRESIFELPEDYDDWDLDQINVSATATLIRRVPPQVMAPVAKRTALAIQSPAQTLSVKRRPPSRLGAGLVISGLSLSLVAAIAWAIRPQPEPIAEASSSPAAPPTPAPLPNRESLSPRRTAPRPTTETLETLESLSQSDLPSVVSATELATQVSMEPGLDPRAFALEGLLPPMQTDLATSLESSANSESPIPASTMNDVLAAGDDSPPPESPQVIQSPPGHDTGKWAEGTVLAAPLAIVFDAADQQPTWNLGRSLSTNNTTLTVTFDLAEGVEQGWIEPLNEVPVKRARGIVVLTPSNEESVAIGIRIDVRTSSKLSLRLRFAARLDPTLPWQSFTRDALLKSLDYLGQQSLLAGTQAEQIEAIYSQSDSNQRRLIRDQRDAAKSRAESYKVLLKRCGELTKLVDRIEATATLSVKLTEGEIAILETIVAPPPAQPAADR